MTNPARILEKLRARPTSLRYDQVVTLLDELDWQIRPSKTGSHTMCTSPRGTTFTVPQSNGQVAWVYLNQLLKEIERGGGL
jgi:predicted RNA binding protein YcfA (HicA-like mRNA interferase family)